LQVEQKVELRQVAQLAGQVTHPVEERMVPVAQRAQVVELRQVRQLAGQERQLEPVK
jgi:hypothetical protein